MKLKPCPVCGKLPKIHYYGINSAYAECKPLFRKAHLTVEVGYASPSMLKEAICNAWNRRADDGMQMV